MIRQVLPLLFSLILMFALRANIQAQVVLPKPDQADLLKSLRADLREARQALKGVGDKQVRDQLELILTRAELKTHDLSEQLSATLGAKKTRVPLSDVKFAALLTSVEGEAFSEKKANAIRLGLKDQWLTCKQAIKLINSLTFNKNKAAMATALYDHVVDPENYNSVVDALTSKFDRDRVRTAILSRKEDAAKP